MQNEYQRETLNEYPVQPNFEQHFLEREENSDFELLSIETDLSPAKESENSQKKKTKRRWKSDNLPCIFTVRTDEDEHQKLKKMAEKTGWSLSRLVVEATLYYGVKSTAEATADRQVFEQMVFEIRKIGINLNQITHTLNAAHRGAGQPPMQGEIDKVLQEIESVLFQLRKKIK